MQTKTSSPVEITETTLDEISGGPHFRNFHGASFDFQSGCDTVLVKNDNMEIHARPAEQG